MEIIDAQLSDLGPDFRDFVLKAFEKAEELIKRALGINELSSREVTVYGIRFDEACLEEVMSPYDVRNCDLDVMVAMRVTKSHYFVVTSAHYTVMFRSDFRNISKSDLNMLGGDDAFLIVTDLYDRVVGSIFFFGMYVFGKVCLSLAVGAVMNHLQKAEVFEKILKAYEGLDTIAVRLELEAG